MKLSDLEIHRRVFERARERVKATPDANPVAVTVLDMIEKEYAMIHQVVPVDPEG